MALNPDEKPKEFLCIVLAVGLKVFGPQAWSDEDRFNAAEKFIAEAEKRYGKLNP
jgi:hypothetical protein